MQTLVTIVIPTYNRSALLREAIVSVLNQDHTDWELIVADDGSTDDTAAMIASMNDERIQFLRMEHTGNIALLRNAGVRAGRGKWVCFLDSDDVWTTGKLSSQLSALTADEERWCYGGFEMMNRNGEPLPMRSGNYHPYSGRITEPLLTNKAAVAIGTLMLSRRLFEALDGFDTRPDLLYREDYELALRLSQHAEAIALPQVLVHIREHAGRSTNHFERAHEQTAWLYGHFAASCADPQLKRTALKRQAYLVTEAAIKQLGQRHYIKGFRLLAKAAYSGDRARHLLSVFFRTRTMNKVPA